MSVKSEQQLLDFAKWYNYHKRTITDPKKRDEFLEDAVENLGLVMVQMIEDVKILEGRGPVGKNFEIISPAGEILKRTGEK